MAKDFGIDQYQVEVVKVFNNIYRIRTDPLPIELKEGMRISFMATEDNTDALLLELRGKKTRWLGANRVIKSDGTTLSANEIVENQVINVVWDGTDWQLQADPQIAISGSSTQAFPGSGALATFAHGLGAKPTWLRVVAIYGGAGELGYVSGDEIEAHNIIASGSDKGLFSVSSDATNVYVSQTGTASGIIVPKTGGAYAGMTEADWTLKIYVS